MKREEAIKGLEYCFDVTGMCVVLGQDSYQISDIFIDEDGAIYMSDEPIGYRTEDIKKIKYSFGDRDDSKVYIIFEDQCEMEFEYCEDTIFRLYTQRCSYRGGYDNMNLVHRLWECKQQTTSDFLIVDKTLHAYMGDDSHVVIPDGVEVIGEYAFLESKIEEVEIPDSVKRIEFEGFCSCKRLGQVLLPNGLKEIGSSAFLGCDELTEVTIPESVERIGSSAFGYMSNLKDVYILGKNTELEEKAFDKDVSVHRI